MSYRNKTTQALGTVVCPKCGEVGHLKKRRRGNKYFFYVDHYKGKKIRLKNTFWRKSGFYGVYEYSCYIGKDFYL